MYKMHVKENMKKIVYTLSIATLLAVSVAPAGAQASEGGWGGSGWGGDWMNSWGDTWGNMWGFNGNGAGYDESIDWNYGGQDVSCENNGSSSSGGSGDTGADNESSGANNAPNGSNQAPSTINRDENEQTALDLVNEVRSQEGLHPYRLDDELIRFARLKSQDMNDNNYFNHHSPTHGSPWEYADALGITGVRGEVIGLTGGGVDSAINMWMNSPGHRAILLSSEYTHLGMSYNGNYWVGVTGVR